MADKLVSLVNNPPDDFSDYLSANGIDTVLLNLLQNLADELPDDDECYNHIVSFILNNRPPRNDDSDNDMEIGEDIEEIPDMYKIRKRRGAVSSEPNAEVEQSEPSLKSNPKDKKTNEKLNEALENHVLCSHLDEGERKEVFDHMFEETYKAGDFVIKQGEDGDQFYVVDDGELEVFVNTKTERKKVQHISPGGSFGELALIYNNPRAADVVAKTDCKLWVIDRVTYRRVLMASTIKKRKLYEEFLDRVPILEPLQKYERLTIADALEAVVFQKDDVIVRQGDKGDIFYIIIEGDAEVTQVDSEGNVKHLIDLHPSDYFGEIALLTDRPRAATVVAKSPALHCVRVDRARFNRVLGPCEDILRRNMESYNKYMANQI